MKNIISQKGKRAFFLAFLFLLISLASPAEVKIRHFAESDGLPQSNVTCVFQDFQGYIWISSWNGLARYDGSSFHHYKARQGDNCPMPSNKILFIREASGGDILCKCPSGFYLFRRKDKRFVALPQKKSDSGDRFRATPDEISMIAALPKYAGKEFQILYRDRQNGYWINSHDGLDRVSFAKPPMSPIKYGDKAEEFVRAIFRDHNGRLFIADKNGYVRIADKSGKPLGFIDANGNLAKGKACFGRKVYCIFEDSHGWLWMGTKTDGLHRLKPTKNNGFIDFIFSKSSNKEWALNCDYIYSIAEDKRGRIIVGTYGGGVNIISNPHSDRPQTVNSNRGLVGYPANALDVRDMELLADGTLLVATSSGLLSCSVNSTTGKRGVMNLKCYMNVRRPTDKMSLSNNQVMDVLKATDGTIYAATYGGGLNIITQRKLLTDKIEMRALTTDNGMASDVCMSLCEDRDGMIWIVSEHCLMMYNPKNKSFTNYTESMFADGFTFSEAEPLCMGSVIYFATTQGTLCLNTANLKRNTFKPKIVFDAPQTIDLSPDKKTLSVELAALDYNQNEPIQYAYMLEGVDKEWMYTRDNHINLTNIPAGTFRLKVRSTNGDGVWMDNEESIMIHRTPYFNERPLAWMLYGGLALALLFCICKAIKYVRKLEQEVKDLRLSKEERMEYLKMRLGDIMDGENEQNNAKNTDFIEYSDFHKKVEDFIEANISNPDLGVTDFAQEVGMSRSAFYVQMKKEFGCTPNGYITEKKILHSVELLRKCPELNISEVAYRSGFSDPKYFSRCFKKIKGCTPTEIRNGNNV